MTREEAKELLPIIQAFTEGKTIEERDPHGNWKEAKNPIFMDSLIYSCVEYRIKPELKYRPFKTKEECWEEMLKHQPFGWLKAKESKSVALIGSVYMDKEVWIVWTTNEKDLYSASEIFNNYVFADGTPFGVKED